MQSRNLPGVHTVAKNLHVNAQLKQAGSFWIEYCSDVFWDDLTIPEINEAQNNTST